MMFRLPRIMIGFYVNAKAVAGKTLYNYYVGTGIGTLKPVYNYYVNSSGKKIATYANRTKTKTVTVRAGLKGFWLVISDESNIDFITWINENFMDGYKNKKEGYNFNNRL